jgi:hypothetical protein
MTDFKEVSTTQHDPGEKGRNTTFKATQVIWLLLGFLEAVLALRFLFKLIGVNPANPFASILYGFTNLFVAPFASLTGAPAAEGMVFEFTTLVAMLVYALIFYGIERLVYVIFYRHHGAVSVKQTTVTDHAPAEMHTTTQVSKTTTTEPSDTQPTNLD